MKQVFYTLVALLAMATQALATTESVNGTDYNVVYDERTLLENLNPDTYNETATSTWNYDTKTWSASQYGQCGWKWDEAQDFSAHAYMVVKLHKLNDDYANELCITSSDQEYKCTMHYWSNDNTHGESYVDADDVKTVYIPLAGITECVDLTAVTKIHIFAYGSSDGTKDYQIDDFYFLDEVVAEALYIENEDGTVSLNLATIDPSIWTDGSYDAATGELRTGHYGFAGWHFSEAQDWSKYEKLVITLGEGSSYCEFKIYDEDNYWTTCYTIAIPEGTTSTEIDLASLTRMTSSEDAGDHTVVISITSVYYAGFWSYGTYTEDGSTGSDVIYLRSVTLVPVEEEAEQPDSEEDTIIDTATGYTTQLDITAINPSIYSEGSYTDGKLVTGQYGFGGVEFSAAQDWSDYDYLDITLSEGSAYAQVRILTSDSYWSTHTSVEIPAGTTYTRIPLQGIKDEQGNATNLTNIYKVGFWTYGGEENAVYVQAMTLVRNHEDIAATATRTLNLSDLNANLIGTYGTFDVASGTLKTDTYGLGGWQWEEAQDWSSYNSLVVNLEEGSSYAELKLATENNVWAASKVAVLSAGSNIIALADLDIDISNIYVAAIWTYGNEYEDDAKTTIKNENPVYISSVCLTRGLNVTTYCSGIDLDFTDTGITAYIAKSLSSDGDALVLTPVQRVPAGTGVILMAEDGVSGTVRISNDECDDVTGNLLVGTTAETTVSSEGDIYLFGRNSSTDEDAFMLLGSGSSYTLPAGKAYLQASATNSAASLRLVFADDSDGISSTRLPACSSAYVYDLSGRRVTSTTKGIYIINGKKILK